MTSEIVILITELRNKQRITLPAGSYRFGRSAQCEYVLRRNNVGDHQFTVSFANGQWGVTDGGSDYRTWYNNRYLEPGETSILQSGDVVGLNTDGDADTQEITFRVEEITSVQGDGMAPKKEQTTDAVLRETDIRRKRRVLIGRGDDCAVLHYPDSEVLVTTDMLMEGVHFDLTYIDLQHLGYKSAMVNISDIFAMNGTPRQLTVSIALSKRFKVEDMEEFYSGLRMACDKWGVDIVGGDTTSSYTGLAISITCIGEARKEDIVYRNGAKDTDLICVTGDLGAAYMGLQLLEREKSVYYQQVDEARKKNDKRALEELKGFQPDFAGKEYLLQRQLQTEARGDIIARFRELNIRPTAMMDISDGLSSELMHICKQSNCGCRIYEKNIPIDYQTAVMAEELNMNVTTCALNGGEDYELLFTVPIGDHEKIQQMDNVKLIGHITRPELGQMLVTRDNQEFELKAQGWNPLSDK